MKRLSLSVPMTLAMIFALLPVTLGSSKDAALVFSAVPLTLAGGVMSLWISGNLYPLQQSWFITLSRVAVLKSVMMVGAGVALLGMGIIIAGWRSV